MWCFSMVWYARDKSSPRTTTFEGAHGSRHARSGRGSSAAIAACKTQGYGVSVVVADRTGTPKVVIVRDGPRGVGPEVARRKAYTAAPQRVSSGDFTRRVSAPGAFNPGMYDKDLSTGEGGVPIKVGDDTIGGIAAAGAPGGDKDEACAVAGLNKIKDRLN